MDMEVGRFGEVFASYQHLNIWYMARDAWYLVPTGGSENLSGQNLQQASVDSSTISTDSVCLAHTPSTHPQNPSQVALFCNQTLHVVKQHCSSVCSEICHSSSHAHGDCFMRCSLPAWLWGQPAIDQKVMLGSNLSLQTNCTPWVIVGRHSLD